MYKEYELKAIYGNVKSYYNKATVKAFDGYEVLKSYNTDVCYIDDNGQFFRTWHGYSPTTARHIDEFRRQHGLKGINKKEWEAIPVVKALSPLKALLTSVKLA